MSYGLLLGLAIRSAQGATELTTGRFLLLPARAFALFSDSASSTGARTGYQDVTPGSERHHDSSY